MRLQIEWDGALATVGRDLVSSSNNLTNLFDSRKEEASFGRFENQFPSLASPVSVRCVGGFVDSPDRSTIHPDSRQQQHVVDPLTD